MPKSQVTICMLLKRNKESQSLIILPSYNCFQMGTFNDVKYYNVIKKKKESMERTKASSKIKIKKMTKILLKSSKCPNSHKTFKMTNIPP